MQIIFHDLKIILTFRTMKLSVTTAQNPHKKSKSRLHTNSSNNFSQKYMKFAKQRLISNTPKKTSMTSSALFSPRTIKNNKLSKQKQKTQSPYAAKSQKININMDIKNLNIYKYTENNSSVNLKKKGKLHKKTSSCLNSNTNNTIMSSMSTKSPEKEKIHYGSTPANANLSPQKIQKKSLLKHNKARSQQNLKLSSNGWSDLLSKYGKKSKKNASKNTENEEIVAKFALCNRCGYCPEKKNKTNQDTYIILENFMKRNRYLFGVCDGHGINGHYVSEFIKEILPENIEYFFLKNKNLKKNTKNNVEASLKEAFKKTSENLIESGIDTMFSGTTACMIYIDHNDLFCVNLGDSRAVLYSKVTSPDNVQEWITHDISTDHKAEDKRQALRIQMNGGRAFPYRDEDGEQMGPYRIWLKDQNIPGLAMTRSFGDYVASTVGVIDEPEITYHQITKQNKFAVIASDGLWEFISKEEVLKIVAPAFVRNDPQSAVNDLEKLAVESWQRQDQSIDDITIIVIFFKYY